MILNYKGFHGCESKCEVQIYQTYMHGVIIKAVVVLTELEDNPGTSVTNFIEELATLVKESYLPKVAPDCIVWVEHYPERGKFEKIPEDFSLVELRWYGRKYNFPNWKPLTKKHFEEMTNGTQMS